MTEKTVETGGVKVKKITLDALVIGTGAAGYNAALRLDDYGVKDIAVVTEGVKMGTSRNTGSDKQTYYKMNLCADYPDSPKAMATDLFNGKCVDGDNAYAEYVTTIEDTSDNLNKKFVIDYTVPNNTSCEYYLYPSSKNSMVGVTLSPIVSNEIKPIWSYWSLIIVDESEKENLYYVNKIFKFELNLKTGDMNNNAVVSINQNFTKYPTVQYGSSNYWSGSLTALCGFISCSDHGYIQTPNMIDELKSL